MWKVVNECESFRCFPQIMQSLMVTRVASDTAHLRAHRSPRFLSATLLRGAEVGLFGLVFSGLSLRSSPFAVSTPFGARPSVHPRSPPSGEYAYVPSFPSRQESAGKSGAPPPQRLPAALA